MKQGQVVVFLVKPDEVGSLAQGHPLVIRPTNGMPTFLIMADPPVLPVMNGRPPAAIRESVDKGYTVHRRPPGRGKGKFECTACGATFTRMPRLQTHLNKAHAAA